MAASTQVFIALMVERFVNGQDFETARWHTAQHLGYDLDFTRAATMNYFNQVAETMLNSQTACI